MIKNIQEVALNQLRKDKTVVTVYLNAGYKVKGILEGFDLYSIFLECEGAHRLIYKHAISAIAPMPSLSSLKLDEPRNDQSKKEFKESKEGKKEAKKWL